MVMMTTHKNKNTPSNRNFAIVVIAIVALSFFLLFAAIFNYITNRSVEEEQPTVVEEVVEAVADPIFDSNNVGEEKWQSNWNI